jgi:hypothetical protein
MEGELWKGLYALVTVEAVHFPRHSGQQYSPAQIVLVLLWAALHDRPVSWACQRCHWPKDLLWDRLPSPATMSRRLRGFSTAQLITDLLAALRDSQPSLCRHMDSKPLPVGGFSKDRDARRGYATGTMARGYKLYCIWGRSVVPDVWSLAPLNCADASLAAELIERLEGGGYLLADATHEGNPLSERAGRLGFQLVSPRRRPNTPLGRGPQSIYRLRSVELLEGPGGFGRSLYREREAIERRYGQLTCFGGGLQPLPSWVRRPHRVAAWVACKLLINAVHVLQNKGLAA